MASDIFKTLVNQKIEAFRSSFSDASVSLFTDEGKLYHPAEFGAYREKALSDLLRSFTPNTYDLSNGFIITPDNKVSTQCDILVVSQNSVTLFNKDVKFHPREQVAGIIEVKSDLNMKQFERALRKLARNKMLFASRYEPNKSFFADETLPFSYLICRKLTFHIEKIHSETLEKIYGDIPRRFWHNAILSLEDGTIEYSLSASDIASIGIKTKADEGGAWYCSEFTIGTLNVCKDAQVSVTKIDSENPNDFIGSFLAMYAVYLPRIRLEPLKVLRYLDCEADIFPDRMSTKVE